MNKNKETAIAVIDQIGGESNVDNLYHCMTRLRFALKNSEGIDLDKIKKIPGVLGAQNSSGEIQIIIGPAVEEVYAEILELTDIHGNPAVKENLDLELTRKTSKKKLSFRTISDGILGAFSAAMAPLIPLFVVVGMANVVAAIIGPNMLNLVSDQSPLYTNFYYIGQSIIYFLPVLTAITASRYFKSNMFVSVAVACLLVYPDLIGALAAEGGYTVFGIAVPNITYGSQLIPVLMIVWVQSYIEKFLNKYIPKSVNVLLVPFGTVVILLPLGLCLLGPLGYNIGSILCNGVLALYKTAGPIETMVVCALVPFMTAFGVGKPIFFACLSILMSDGVEFAYMPIAMVLNNWMIMGCCSGYIIKTKSAEKKQYGITSLIANFLGGVSEPTLFGIILPNRKTFLPLIVGGAVSGLYLGVMKVGYYAFGPSNFLGVIGFVNPEGGNNFIHGCIASGIAFVVTFIMMIVTYKENEAK